MTEPTSRGRGPHPADEVLFSLEQVPTLRRATADYSWLLDRDYAEDSALKLVGDRYQLRRRQRDAVSRCACGTGDLGDRTRRQVSPDNLLGQAIVVDAFNQLITTETGLSGGVVLKGCDGAHRDLAGVHGTWRRRERSREALIAIGKVFAAAGTGEVIWCVDRPVSNSGRLRALLLEIADESGWQWRAEIVADADPVLMASRDIVVSSDRHVLDHCGRWFEALSTVFSGAPSVWVVDLSELV